MNHVLHEFRKDWLPHITSDGLARLIELLESGSPLLIHGAFNRSCAMGCLATHIAWHHPQTQALDDEAGVSWLTRVAKLNPATSRVIQAWDRAGSGDWHLRTGLVRECRKELAERQNLTWNQRSSDTYNGVSGVVGDEDAVACNTH